MSQAPEIQIEGVEKLLELEDEIARLEKDLKAKQAEQDALKEQLLQQFEARNLKNLKVGRRLVYVHRSVWASVPPEHAGEVKRALRDLDLSEFIKETVNSQQLSAHVREYPEDDQGMPSLPEQLQGLLRVTEKYDLRIRKS